MSQPQIALAFPIESPETGRQIMFVENTEYNLETKLDMETRRLYYIWMGTVVIATALLFASNLVTHSTIQVGMISAGLLLVLVPLLYEPRLQVMGWRTGLEGPADERHQLIIFRTGWYAYHLLLGVVTIYIMVNGATDLTIPTWGLGFAFVGIFTGYWVIAWWQSRVI